jgi:hypothetical protein
MSATIQCTACGAFLQEPIGPCPLCGGPVVVSVGITGVSATTQLGGVDASARESLDGGGERIRYSASSGACSDSALVETCVRAHVQPPVDVGKRGEERVFARVLDVLAATGSAPVIDDSAADSAGEDRVVLYRQERITIQIVAATPRDSFWKDVATGSGEVEADLDAAATWAHEAISEKARRYSTAQKHTMLLAIDLRHLGVLAVPAFVSLYLRVHGAPDDFGFGGVWLIGPTDDRCIRLGHSRW